MSIYIKLFEVIFPVFFVVGIGYYLGKKNPKIDTTFITNFAANVGTPAMIIYALNPVNISFNIFLNYFWYYALAICGFMFTGIIILYLLNTKDIIRELPPLTMPNTKIWVYQYAYLLMVHKVLSFCSYICIDNFMSFYFGCIFS